MSENLYLNNITGLLDVDSLVQGLLRTKLINMRALQQKKASLQLQVSALNNLLGAIKDLKSSVDSLNIDSSLSGKKVEIGDNTLLSASASKSTPNISFSLEVLQLSQTEIRLSEGGVRNLNEPLSLGNFRIKYWLNERELQEFNLEFRGGTIQDLINLINQSQDKITASLFFDGKDYKVMLSEKNAEFSSKETRVDSPVLEIEGNFPLQGFLTLQEARNSKILIGSSNIIENPGRTFKEILPGLTLTVNKEGKTNINIKDDYSALNNELSKIINSINSLLSLVNSNTDKGQPFQGNAVLTQIKPQIFSAIKPLVGVGIVKINEGSYSLDTNAIGNLIKNDPEKLKQALREFKELLSNTAQGLVSTFNVYKKRQDLQASLIDQKISNLRENIVKEEQKLRLTFSKIESLMYHNEQLRARLQDFVTSILKQGKSES